MGDHNLAVIGILTIGFALASLFAYIAQRLKVSSMLGYLIAGFVIGPYSPGYVADLQSADQLAEIGVILMLFSVGLHFKLEDLYRVKNIAVPGAIVQALVAVLFSTVIVYAAGWSLLNGLLIGLAVGVTSTTVLVRVLSDNSLLNTQQGHIAVGWLVVEDVLIVLILVLLPTLAALGGGENLSLIHVAGSVLMVFLKFGTLMLFMFTWGQQLISFILTNVARLRSQELLTLTVLSIVFLIAVGSVTVFGMSAALGAFIAGMVVGKTTVRHQAAANSLPLKDVFAIIFFITIGMLFNPRAIIDHFPLFLGIIGVILVVKPLLAYLITKCFGYPLKVALTVALSVAQIGELSFILSEVAVQLKLLPEDGFDLLVACAMVSISINPLLFKYLDFFEYYLQKFKFFNNSKNGIPALRIKKGRTSPKVIVVGMGPIGQAVSTLLIDSHLTSSVIENNVDTVSRLEEATSIIYGDAANESILQDAHIGEAALLIITIPDTHKTIEIIQTARRGNPQIEIIARSNFVAETPVIVEAKVHYICTESEALKAFVALTKHVLHSNGI